MLPGLDVALENTLPTQSQIVLGWIQVHGIYQENVLGFVDVQQDMVWGHFYWLRPCRGQCLPSWAPR